jgi:fibronectin-binding autotransporter adhesin
MKLPVAPPGFPAPVRAIGSILAASLILVLFLLVPAHTTFAQTVITAAHSGSFNLSTGSNWSSNATPTTSNILEWTSTVTGAATTDTTSAGLSVAGLQIVNPAAGVTIGGTNALTLGASGINLSAATVNLTISDLLILGASQTWTVAAGQSLAVTNAGAITGSGNSLTVAGAGNVTLSSILGTGAGSLTMAGTGTLTLSGVNTYTGGTTISAGTVVVGNNLNALGALGAPVVMTGGTLVTGNGFLNYDFGGTGGTLLVPAGEANSTLGSATDPAAFNFGGTLSIGAGSAVTIEAPATATVGGLMLNTATLSTNFGLVLAAGGTLTDTGNSTINGTFVNSQVRTGTGPSPTFTPTYTSATVTGPASGSTLTISGTLNQGGGFGGTIAIIGTYNPDNAGAIVTVAPAANISFGVSAATTLNIGGLLPGQFDQFQLGSGATFNLGGTLTLSNVGVTTAGTLTGGSFALAGGQTFQIFSLSGGAVAGAFASVSSPGSNLLAWDTSALTTTGVLSLDFTNNYWIGTTKTLSSAASNFSTTNATPGAAQTFPLQGFSNVFLSAAGAANATTQTLGGTGSTPVSFNSLSFIAGGDTLLGKTASANSSSLSLGAANSFQDQNGNPYAAGIGLVMQSGATGGVTISSTVHIDLLSSQTWEIDASTLSVASAITDTVSGLSGQFSLTKTGVGTLILTNTKSSYQGGTNVAGGTLIVTGNGGLGASTLSGTLTLSGGTLDIDGTTQSASGVNLASGTIMNSGASTAKIVVSGAQGGIVSSGSGTATLAATLTGSAGLAQNGSGTLNVLANQLYSGLTAISEGVVEFSSAGALTNTSGTTVGTAGTLGGTGTVSGGVTDLGGGTLAPGVFGATPSAGRLTLGSLTLSSGSSLALNLNTAGGGTGFSQIVVNGALNLNSLGAGGVTVTLSPAVANNLLGGGSSYTWASVITATSLTGTAFNSNIFTINGGSFASGAGSMFSLIQDAVNPDDLDLVYSGVSVIPEPSAVALLSGLGMLGFVTLRRRRAPIAAP